MNSDEQNEIIKSAIKYLGECIKTIFYQSSELDNQACLYHYTDMNALLSGIVVPNPNENEEICLRATRWNHLNDREEIEAGLNLIGDGSSERLAWLREGVRKYHSTSCLLSFSKNTDCLPMWGMYGKNGTGIMLGFDTHILRQLFGYRMLPCSYADSEYDEDIIKKLGNLDLGNHFESLNNNQKLYLAFMLTALFVSTHKNASFAYENEVRIVGLGNVYYGFSQQKQYRISKGIITPYVDVYLPRKALKEVWLGPTLDKDLAKESMKEFLESRGFNDVEVKVSQVPYRG